jgi:hypothetical protein
MKHRAVGMEKLISYNAIGNRFYSMGFRWVSYTLRQRVIARSALCQ